MRIELSDSDGRLFDDAYYRVLVHSFFPKVEDASEREQVLLLVEHERKRRNEVGRDSYRPSKVTVAVADKVGRKSGQLMTCGYVGLAMLFLEASGRRVSLESAAQVVSEMNYAHKKLGWISMFSGEPKAKTINAMGALPDVKSAFREYRSAVHIIAARLIASEYMELLPLWEEAPLAERALLSTVVTLQQLFARLPNADRWNMWDVCQTMPKELLDYPTLLPSDEFIRNLLFPSFEQSPQLWGI